MEKEIKDDHGVYLFNKRVTLAFFYSNDTTGNTTW